MCIRSGVNDGAMKKYMSVESLNPAANLAVDSEGETTQFDCYCLRSFVVKHVNLTNIVNCQSAA